jgi:hypothetical protein
MTKSPRDATWFTVDVGGVTRTVSAPEVDPDRPFEGIEFGAVATPSAPRRQLVIGSLTDAARLESAIPDAGPFRWADPLGVDVAHLAVLLCLGDGVDPSALLDPIEEERNPFTAEVFRRTVHDRRLDGFEVVLDGTLVSRLARMPEETFGDVARQWARAWSTLVERGRRGSPALSEDVARCSLDALVSTAKLALAGGHELFVREG